MSTSRTPGKLDAPGINLDAFRYYERLGRVKRYLERHYTDDVSLGAAARVACLDEKYFSHYFHEKTGIRFIEFVSYLRVERALHLMRQHDTAISMIARQVGYNSPRTFERAFKKWTGTTPRRFRAHVRPS